MNRSFSCLSLTLQKEKDQASLNKEKISIENAIKLFLLLFHKQNK